MGLLHTHVHESEGVLLFLEEVLLHGLIDTLKLVPFLFLTYLLMEFIEHRAGDRAEHFMERASRFAPFVGGALGAVPQCGFSAAASNFYAARVISLGTLIAVFLSTSDEMLPILISGDFGVGRAALLVLYKLIVGIIVGFLVDLILRLMRRGEREINIDNICENDNCHCERGILHSALHHTVTITLFVLAITVAINTVVFFVGTDVIAEALDGIPVVSHIIAALLGLIPNCAVSVALATFFSEGFISVGTMLSGLFSGAGVGILVLFRVNKNLRENLAVMGVLVLTGSVFGLIGDLIFPF